MIFDGINAQEAGLEDAGLLWYELGAACRVWGGRAAYERALKILRMYFSEDHPNVRIVKENFASWDQ